MFKGRQQEIFEYILTNTPVYVINDFLKFKTSFQRIYSRHRNILVHQYFEGSQLKFSIELREMFNKFLTISHELEIEKLYTEIGQMKEVIKHRKRYSIDYKDLAEEHNEKVDRLREINEGVNKFLRAYRKQSKRRSSIK